jgi:hypothetical protein
MPFLDRFWWLRLLLGGALLVTSLLFALWYLNDIAPIDLGYGPFGFANAILAAETILILIYAGLVYLWRALRARSWRARRLDALAGNRDAIPLARQAPETSASPDRETLPWQVTYPTPDLFFSMFIRVIMLTLFLSFAGFLVPLLIRYAQSLISLNGPLILFGANSQPTAPGMYPIAFFALIPLYLTLIPQYGPASVWDRQPERCVSLVADDEGMQWRARSGRERSMKWSDIRLFEVMYPSAHAQGNTSATTWRISILYSGEQTVWWRERVSGDGKRRSERFANLERLIETKTALQPRTFDPLLMPTAQRNRNQVARWTIMLLALYLPLLTYAEARDVKASIVVAAGLGAFLIFALIQVARTPVDVPAETNYVEFSSGAADTPIDEADHLYEMRTSARWYERARALGIILGAGVSLAFAARLLYGMFEFAGPTGRHIVDLLSLVTIADIFGGFATLLTIGLMRSRPTIVRANGDGLMQDGPIAMVFVPWSGIVSLERNENATPFYEVEGDVGHTVKWPVQAPQSLTFTPSAGASLVEPEQLAKIVMARSGVPATTRARSKRTQRAGGEIR